jgi:hypothetical protein
MKMEAKDTVMGADHIGDIGHCEYDKNSLMVIRGINIKTIVEEQAEISFKAGIKEVVDWIWFNPQLTKHQNWQNYPEWQAKLKEWGIE